MNININNGISVDTSLTPKKNYKTDKDTYSIFIKFTPYQNGISHKPHLVSTGIKVKTCDWKSGHVTAKTPIAKRDEQTLNKIELEADTMLRELSLKRVSSISALMAEIEMNAGQRLTGKAQKGTKEEKISMLKEYSYENIMNRLFADRNISVGRRRGYNRSFNLLKEYFKGDIPTMDVISDTDLDGFKIWFKKHHKSKPDSNGNGVTDYLSKIAAVFKYALKLKVISISPLPEKFRGSWQDGNRKPLTEEECLSIIELSDLKLSNTQQVAKYCLLVQLLSGMGYGDMEKVKHEHIKYDNNEKKYFIEKERNKTNVKFKVFLTAGALQAVNKLRELTGDENMPFNLPTIDYSLRVYKEIGGLAGVKTHITTYTMRHTFAVNFMENDGQLEDLQKFLGHANPKTTLIYGKISNKRLARKTVQLEQKSKMHQLNPTNKITRLQAV